MYEQLVKRLKQHKANTGLTWEMIAEEIGVSFSLILKLANGQRRNPTLSTCDKIDTYLRKHENTAA